MALSEKGFDQQRIQTFPGIAGTEEGAESKNPKFEYRNSKQIRIFKIRNPKTLLFMIPPWRENLVI
jgi:hypothetical protein